LPKVLGGYFLTHTADVIRHRREPETATKMEHMETNRSIQ